MLAAIDEVADDVPVTAFERSVQTLSLHDRVPMLLALRRTAQLPALPRREIPWHAHDRGQICCIEHGVIHMRTERGAWLLPPHRAAWIPPGMRHAASLSGVSTSWSLFISPSAATTLPDKACVMDISELSRLLLRRASGWTWDEQRQPRQRRLLAVLLDELRHASREVRRLPMPTDRRLLRIAQGILDQPAQTRTLDQWADWAGMSPRTANRLFNAEVGISFALWRQHAMLMHATTCLARGDSVGAVADALGYSSPSNFIAMFRRCFGESPTRYLSRREAAA